MGDEPRPGGAGAPGAANRGTVPDLSEETAVMTIWCDRCRRYGHAEAWHRFSYRRWWVAEQILVGRRPGDREKARQTVTPPLAALIVIQALRPTAAGRPLRRESPDLVAVWHSTPPWGDRRRPTAARTGLWSRAEAILTCSPVAIMVFCRAQHGGQSHITELLCLTGGNCSVWLEADSVDGDMAHWPRVCLYDGSPLVGV